MKIKSKSERKLIKLNRFFLITCAAWASLNTELGFPTKKWLVVLDRITQIWSLIILLTSLVKFLKFPPDQHQPQPPPTEPHKVNIKDLLLLNYLPRINEFGKLYYGLVCISIGAALVWRVYLNFYRPNSTKRSLKCQFAISTTTSTTEGRPIGHCNRSNAQLFNAKCELIEFFMNGPRQCDSDERSRLMLSRRRHANAFERLISVRHLADQLAYRFHRHDSLDPVKLPRQKGYLSRQHRKSRSSSIEAAAAAMQVTTVAGAEQSVAPVYRIPIRSADFLDDRSQQRWNHLAKVTFSITGLILAMSVPLAAYCIVGLRSVHGQFALDYPKTTTTTTTTTGAHDYEPSQLYFGLLIYGCFEQAYACTQAAMFFIFTNIFITLFLADLTYKLTPIRREVEILAKLYRVEKVHRLPREEIYRQQLRLWAFYDNIFLLDDFVAKYAIVSMTTLIIGLSFGQSYLKVADPTLKSGTLAALISNFLSFTYLHLISWYIEQRSNPIHKAILSILARETNHEAKRDWQRTLFAFFAPDWKRTFTLGGRYPLNLQSYFRTIFGLATISLVINRLFIKRAWEASFVHGNTMAAANKTTI